MTNKNSVWQITIALDSGQNDAHNYVMDMPIKKPLIWRTVL